MTTDPVIERLADPIIERLATITNMLDELTRRIEHLERLDADNIAAWDEHFKP